MTTKDSDLVIFKVAFLLTALDGDVSDSERAMFARLLTQYGSIDAKEAQNVLASVERSITRILGEYGKPVRGKNVMDRVLAVFEKEVDAVCDWADFARSSERVRRAFAMWLSMTCSDNDYSEVERRAVASLQARVNACPIVSDAYLKSAESEVVKIVKASAGLSSAKSLDEDVRLHGKIDAGLARLERMIRD